MLVLYCFILFIMSRCPPKSTLFPYTTLFRSARRPRGSCRVRDLELLRLRRAERDAALRSGVAMARVVVTGVGVVTGPVTGGREHVRAFLASSGAPVVSVRSSALDGLVDETEARRLSRICQLSVAAARIALADAGLGPGAGLGLVIGAEFGDVRSTIAFVDGYLRRGPGGLSALLFPNTVMNTMAAATDRKSTRLNSSHTVISYAVF